MKEIPKLNKLTPEQEKRCDEITKEWLKIGLDTSPADRPRAEAGVRLAYKLIGEKEPEEIIWVGSPMAAATLAAERCGGDPATYLSGFVYGQHLAGWLSFYDAMHQILGSDISELEGLMEIAKSAGWWLPFEGFAICCDRPLVISYDDRDRLHSENGPALAFRDGVERYIWHGVSVPKKVVMAPETLTVEEIDAERNVEVRRIMLERFGSARYVKESGATHFAEDDYGQLYRKEVADDEPVVMLRVINATPENVLPGNWRWLDPGRNKVTDDEEMRMVAKTVLETERAPRGYVFQIRVDKFSDWVNASTPEYKEYWLRVPPDMTSPKQAVAWTFGIDNPKDYNPLKQS